MANQKTIYEVLFEFKDGASKEFQAASKKVEKSAGKSEKAINKSAVAMNKAGSSLKTFKNGLIALAGSYAAVQTVRFLTEAAQAAENYNRQLSALSYQASRVGIDANKLVRDLRAVTQGQVAMEDLVSSANRSIALIGSQSIPHLDKLADAGMKAAQVMGISVEQAIENLATGIGRQSRLILDNLGVIISVTEANENYAKALGKTTDELTEVEKKTAFMLEVTKQLDDKFGELDVTLSATDGFRASIKDLKREIGDELLPAYKEFLQITLGIIQAYKEAGQIFTQPIAQPPAPSIGESPFAGFAERKQQALLQEIMDFVARPKPPVKIIDKAQIKAVDELKLKVKEAREQLRLLKDPEVKGLMNELKSLEKQISQQLNPTIKKQTFDIMHLNNVIYDLTEAFTPLKKTIEDTFTTSPIENAIQKFNEWVGILKVASQPTEMSPFYQGAAQGRQIRDYIQTATGKTFNFSNIVDSIRDAFRDSDEPMDLELDTTSLSLQFATALTQAFQVGSVRSSLGSLLQSGASLLSAANVITPGALGPIGAGISLVSSLVDMFGGGRRQPVITEPLPVRVVNFDDIRPHLLGISKNRLIAASASIDRGLNNNSVSRELAIMP